MSDSLARAREVWDEIVHSSDCWIGDDECPEPIVEGIARRIATAIDKARLHDEAYERFSKAVQCHLKEWPALGDCEWNCVTMGGLREFVERVQLEARLDEARKGEGVSDGQ